MALVVFLRGVNVGGHRQFRPGLLATELAGFDVVNIGAAGTLVARRPGSRTKFRAELIRRLPFKADVALCDGRDLLALEKENPFAGEPASSDVVRFVSVLSKPGGSTPPMPLALPTDGEWLVRLIAIKGQFVCGLYRRHMKTIGHLGRIDRLFGARVTTRNWNTILAVNSILNTPTA